MGDAADLREKSMAAEEDLQAFDYARKRAGDVTELFGVLKGRLRPGQKGPELAVGEEGKASSGHSVLQAQYSGSSGSTVLSQANLKRIQTFLDEPQKHLGQVIADIEKEAGNFYEQVSSLKPAPKRLQRGRLNNPLVKNGQLVSLEDVPEMNKYLGPSSRFGDGDGSFWDRWLTTTGHFTEQGNYAKAHIPTRSMYATGTVPPRSGFKRYQLDKLAFPEHPEPRVLSYAARRELADTAKGDDAPKRLRGAYSERCLSPATTAWLDDVLAKKAAEEAKAAEEGRKNKDGLNQKEEIARTDTRCSTAPRTSSSGGEGGLSDGPEQAPAVLKHLRQKFRTLGDVGARRGSPERPVVWHSALVDETKEETPEEKEAPCGLCAGSPEKKEDVSGEVTVGVRRRSMEGAIASLGLVHPNYFGKRARMHMYSYFKQVSRRKHQYGDRQAMALIPLSPLDRMDMLSTYEASVDVIKTVSSQDMISLADIPFADGPMDGKHTGGGSSDDTLQRRLPPLVMPGAVSGGRITRGGKEEKDQSSSLDEAGGTPHVTSRTKYLVRCTEYNVAPKANIIIRKTLTTKVNLAHQGMGDVMGGILADCLVGLPLMRELNLRDNRLTDKGLIPIVKAIKQRHDLYALDLSENKLDRWAARELAVYFSDPKTTLAKFVLSKADVDDFEAANFVKHMRHNKTLTSLDISHNLIGSQESINYVRPEFYTGAEALADWISTGSCPLKYLDVSWNTIRLDSAVYFGNAVAYATHLEELDLSFNCFGAKGGEAIGASLHINTSLKKLGLASNSINPRACFVICQGLRYSSSIRSINLANNALGRIGVGCVMALTAEIGDAIKIQLAHCNFMVDSEDCWFEDDKLKPSYTLQLEEPYDRAVALHLTRRAARDEGLKLKVVTHTIIGESEKEIKLERKIAAAESLVADHAFWKEIFHKYDANGSGSLDRGELAEALRDLDVAGGIQVDVVMSRHDNGDDRIEEAEFHEFVHASILQSRRRADRSKAFIAEESKPGTPWVVPWEGKLRVELQYNRLHNQGCHTSLESTDGVLAMLEGIGDGLAEVMTHALDCISVDLEQGFRMYTAVLKRLGGDKIKALAKVIPRMESTSDARLLKNTILSGLDERRKLRHNLGPAYRPLMGTPMGHYELDMAKPTHRMAARKILEINNMEKLARQAGPPLVFDVSQKGNWDNIRNETMNGKPFRFKSGILEDNSHKAGLLAMDYVSTARRSVKSGGVANPQQAVMNAKRFHEMLHLVGLSEDVDWAEVSEEDFDQAIDDALAESPPRPRTPQLFEQLHFLMTGEGPAGTKRPILTRPSAVDKQANAGGQKQSVPKSILQSGFGAKSNLGQIESEETGEQSNEQRNPGLGILTGAHVGLNAMACRLDELMADRWLSIRQCRFMVLAVEEAFEGDEVLQDVIVDFVVTVYPRIVDVHDYLVLVGCLEERSAAFVLKRVGMLAAWNACRPDGYLELALDRKEERLVAKMLVHLKTEERGEQWVSTSFRWSMYDQPTPGWMLPLAWHTEEGIPTKGVLTCEYRTGPHINWIVRLALARTLSLCELPPGGAALGIMGTGNRPASPTGGGARIGEEGDLEGRNKRVMSGVGSYDVDSPFDREFVDALCRQAGNNFFLYGGS